MEYIKDYDFPIKYHLWKANIVANALSKKIANTGCLQTECSLMKLFRDLAIEFQPQSERVMVANTHTWEPDILDMIKSSQKEDPELVRLIDSVVDMPEFRLIEDVLYCQDGLCVPDVQNLRNEIMVEAHHTRYVIHLGSTKTY